MQDSGMAEVSEESTSSVCVRAFTDSSLSEEHEEGEECQY